MYPSLCESKTNNYRCAALTSLSQPCLPVSNVGPTRILPFLYLGSQQDALSQDVTQVVSLYDIPLLGPIKKIKPRNFATSFFTLSWAGAILKESTCLLRHISTEKSGLCQYAVCIIQNTKLKEVASTEWRHQVRPDFFLVDLREFFFRSRVGGTKKNK